MAEHKDEHDKGKGGHGGGGHGGGHGPGGGGHGDGEHEGAPEWLISFADNVVLMMGFFVILLALNLGPKGKNAEGSDDPSEASAQPSTRMIDFVIGVREAFHNPIDINSTAAEDAVFVRRLRERYGMENNPDAGPEGQGETMQSIRPSNYQKTAALVMFEQDVVRLDDRAVRAVRDAAFYLRGLNVIIEVRGHASAAETYENRDGGWRMSFDRAMAVAKELHAQGIDWRRLRVVACGDTEKQRPNAYDQPGHRLNQRVEIVETDTLASDWTGSRD